MNSEGQEEDPTPLVSSMARTRNLCLRMIFRLTMRKVCIVCTYRRSMLEIWLQCLMEIQCLISTIVPLQQLITTMTDAIVLRSLGNLGKNCSKAFNITQQFCRAWWHTCCGIVALNGKYDPDDWRFGFRWESSLHANGFHINPKISEMKIRRNLWVFSDAMIY